MAFAQASHMKLMFRAMACCNGLHAGIEAQKSSMPRRVLRLPTEPCMSMQLHAALQRALEAFAAQLSRMFAPKALTAFASVDPFSP